MTLWESIQREIDEANRGAIEIIKPSEQETERGLRVNGEAIGFDFGPPGKRNTGLSCVFQKKT